MSKLMDLCFNITDGEHGTVIDDPKGNFFLLSNKNIVNGKVNIDPKLDRRINESTFNKINKRTKIETNDVLISTVGTIGKTSIVEKSVNFAVQRSVGIIKTNHQKLNPYYLKYQLMTSEFQNRLKLLSKGAVQKCLFIEDLKNMEVLCPSIETQNKVAHTLKILEDKISNNNKINAELESLAKTIYDYWFLQFEFPNEEGKPYKSSGGKIVWNEDLKREIPEGWKTATLDKVISVSNERISSKEIGDRLYVPIECIPRKQMSFYETADIEKAATGLCPFDENSILISNRRVYFHKVSITPFKGVTRDTVIIVNPLDKNNLGYVFQLLFSDHFISIATLNSYGTEQPVFSPTSFSQYRITIPNNSLDIEYSKKVKPIINRILENQRENKKLSSLRDFLLPMLMNGQVQFK